MRIVISSPYYVDPSLGADPIANAIGTYVLSRDRSQDAALNNGFIYYSLTPSGQSYSVDYPSISSGAFGSWYYVPNGGVYANAAVACGTLLIGGAYVAGVSIDSISMIGKFLPNSAVFGRYDVWTSSFGMPGSLPAAACSTSAQTTARPTGNDVIRRYNSDGTVATPPFNYSYISYNNATVTVQLNG